MARGTLIFLFILAILVSLLIGVNIGKNLRTQESTFPKLPITNYQLPISPSPTLMPPSPTPATPSASPSPSKTKKIMGTSTFRNTTCGFSFSYPGSYLSQKTVNEYSIILTDPENPNAAIATTCAENLPRPPVDSSKIESIIIDRVAATLYHDQNPDGTPRDEVIVKHPRRNLEIIIAGYGETFQQALSSFKFLK